MQSLAVRSPFNLRAVRSIKKITLIYGKFAPKMYYSKAIIQVTVRIDILTLRAVYRFFRKVQQAFLGQRRHCGGTYKRAPVAAALIICPLILTACGLGARSDGLPTPPGDADCPATGSQIADNGLLTTSKLHGPACRDIKEFQFQEAGQDTAVDLEHFSSGGIADLSYDHFTGELKPINRTRVSLYYEDNGWGWSPWGNEPKNRGDYPGEQECQEKRAGGQDVFSKDDLKAKFGIFCITTAEGHDGFLIVRPMANHKPAAYDVYSYIWVR